VFRVCVLLFVPPRGAAHFVSPARIRDIIVLLPGRIVA